MFYSSIHLLSPLISGWLLCASCSVFTVRADFAGAVEQGLTPPAAQIQQRLGFGRDEKFSEGYIIDVLRDARSQMDAWQSEWDLVMSAFWTGVSLLILISLSRCAPWRIWLLSFFRGDSARICKSVSQ